MGANSTQGLAVMTFLVAFTLMPLSLVWGGSVVFLIGLASFIVSIMTFLKVQAAGVRRKWRISIMMIVAGLAIALLGFVISVASLGITESVGGRMAMVIIGIAVSLFGIMGVLNKHYLKIAIWRREDTR